MPLTILAAVGLLLAGVVCGLGVRVALLYIETSQVADSAAVKAASLSAAGLEGCAYVLTEPTFRSNSCSDSGFEVEVEMSRSLNLLWGNFEVVGQARIGYLKMGSGG